MMKLKQSQLIQTILWLFFISFFGTTQSKALNSNSGVAFSPPSIVKDTLGDSGMLLDTDMTMTNSPDASPSQVHNIINKIENKLMMSEDSGDVQQQQPHHHHHHHHQQHTTDQYQQQTFTFARFKPLYSFSLNNETATAQPFNAVDTNVTVQMPKMEVKQFNRKIHRSLSGNATVHTIGGSALANVRHAIHANRGQWQQTPQFNPYADENDSSSRFQLSKSVCNISAASSSSMSDDSSQQIARNRFFGNDRTNYTQNDRLPNQGNPSRVINLRKENYHTINISNNMIIKNPNTTFASNHSHHPHLHHSNSHIDQENPVMFRNYDLNDEYWLNFE